MNDDQPRPDTGHLDMSPHDQTPDMSLDTSMSIREASAMADVTEKTIRRWIKSGRLHAIKLGGQYRITVADLERARGSDVQTLDVGCPVSGHHSPRVDMSTSPDTGQEAQATSGVDLTPLVDHIAILERQVSQLTEAATVWQIRARQAEEQLKQLSAGGSDQREATESPESVGDDANVETYRVARDTSAANILARLKRLIRGAE